MSAHKSSREAIRWLDVAVAAQRGTVTASIYPVEISVDAPSFAVTIDHRWVEGGDGKLSVFETPHVARRFLELLGITQVKWKGAGKPPKLPDHASYRRFYLSRYRLMEDTDNRHRLTGKSSTHSRDWHESEETVRACG